MDFSAGQECLIATRDVKEYVVRRCRAYGHGLGLIGHALIVLPVGTYQLAVGCCRRGTHPGGVQAPPAVTGAGRGRAG